MIYQRSVPKTELQSLINCYWLIDSEGEREIQAQKIVPDGYPEIIIHYADPYKINLGTGWLLQQKVLLAGQIRKHFYLENTGVSGMLGIKLEPAALSQLFGLDMSAFTDRVITLPAELSAIMKAIDLGCAPDSEALFSQLDELFTRLMLDKSISKTSTDRALELIIHRKGNVSVQALCELTACSERQLERQFKRQVGISPKFYCRIIRLGHIFELMERGDQSWSDLVYDSGFYDQSHFIKNFKEFTGEDPSSYGFEEQNMANFHLKK